MEHPKFCEPNIRGRLNEDAIEKWINDNLFTEDKSLLAKKKQKRLELGGRLSGIEFYDALFFYMTKYMKNMKTSQLPKRNLAEFLEEYLVRFKDGDNGSIKRRQGVKQKKCRRPGGQDLATAFGLMQTPSGKMTDNMQMLIGPISGHLLNGCVIVLLMVITKTARSSTTGQDYGPTVEERDDRRGRGRDCLRRCQGICRGMQETDEDVRGKEEEEAEDSEGEE